MMMRVVCSLIAILPFISVAEAKSVTISNVNYRTNVTGEIMDAHDGSYNLWNGSWYYHAMGYGTCHQEGELCSRECGYGYSWIGVWKSPDMSDGSWALVREARDDTWPNCIYFRVHTVYNNNTGKFVMWVNLNGNAHRYAVGMSDSPEGPFTFVNYVDDSEGRGGDFDIFINDDSEAFLIYSTNHRMELAKLSADYLTIEPGQAKPQPFGINFVEAPAMFKRNGLYYALFGNCCCFCTYGSGIGVYTATAPLGPWTYHNNVGCLANTTLAPGCGCGMVSGTCDNVGQSLTKAQQNYVIRVPQPDGSEQLVWTGDRWGSAPDGIKAHDLQYWSVLKFTEVKKKE
jgi:hypothetical protein